MNLFHETSMGYYINQLSQMSSICHDMVLELLDYYGVYGTRELTLDDVRYFHLMVTTYDEHQLGGR